MTNHPDRTSGPRLPETFLEALAEAQQRAGLTDKACAALAHAGLRTWEHWRAGTRGMPTAAIELWCLASVAGGHLVASDPFVRMWVRPLFVPLLKRA